MYVADTTAGTAVYTAGYYENSDGEDQPCYWKGTVRVDLSLPSHANAFGILAIRVVDNIVYTAGWYGDENTDRHLFYWKDTTFVHVGKIGQAIIDDIFIEVK